MKQPKKELAIAVILLCLASVALSINKTRKGTPIEEGAISADQTICFDRGNLCYTDLTTAAKLVDIKGQPSEYKGQTWAIAWGNANNNEWPDLYLNHHKYDNTKGRFPNSHLILDFGKNLNTKDFIELPGDDQHSAVFIDLDSDGIDEIIETIGGFGGTSLKTDAESFNIVHDLSKKKNDSTAASIGIEQGGARGRQVTPFNLNNTLFLAFLNKDREDGLYGSEILKKGAMGVFTPYSLSGTKCQNAQNCHSKLFALNHYQTLNYGLLSDDSKPGLVACQSNIYGNIKAAILAPINQDPTIVETAGEKNYRFCEISFLPASKENILITESRGSGISLMRLEPTTNSLQSILSLPSAIEDPWTIDLRASDMNNDGYPDIVALQERKKQDDTTALVLYLSSAHSCNRPEKLPSCYKTKVIHLPGTPAPRNFSLADFDNDGSTDIFIGAGKTKPGPSEGGKYIFLSGKSSGNWLTLDLKCRNGSNGLGSLVKITSDSSQITKLKNAASRYETQDDQRIHVGLGKANNTNLSVEVTWPNGAKRHLRNIKPNQLLNIDGGNECTRPAGRPDLQTKYNKEEEANTSL
jgi:hypothetical protein